MDIHVRTKIDSWWSFIEAAVLRIGDQTLEIKGGMEQIPYWINGKETANMETGETTLGDFPVKFRRLNPFQSMARIDLGNGDALSIETFKHFVRVNIKDKSKKAFKGSMGLLGVYPAGKKVARDGTTVIDDAIEFGMEWQVKSTEPWFFHSLEGVQHPEACALPNSNAHEKAQRRLGESALTYGEANLACSHAESKDRKDCVFDVLATNDLEMAASY